MSNRLEQAGLIRRVPDPSDRRGVLIEPTKAGHGGFLGGEYGQVGKPDEFAAKLREVLK